MKRHWLATWDGLPPDVRHMLIRDAQRILRLSSACVGCGKTDAGSSLWCPACWRVADKTGYMPDTLLGGMVIRKLQALGLAKRPHDND